MVHVLCVRSKRGSQTHISDDSMRVSSPRLVAKQTCRNSALSLGIWEDRSLDGDRSGGGWMEWSGAVKVRAGVGVGVWGGGGARGMGRGVVTVPFHIEATS